MICRLLDQIKPQPELSEKICPISHGRSRMEQNGCPFGAIHGTRLSSVLQQKIPTVFFNSAVVSFEDGFAGVFRCDSKSISMDIFAGFSKDGIHWEISDGPIAFQGRTPRPQQNGISAMTQEYAFIEDRYYITCNALWLSLSKFDHRCRLYIPIFRPFTNWKMHFCHSNRNGAAGSRKIRRKLYMPSRPSDK